MVNALVRDVKREAYQRYGVVRSLAQACRRYRLRQIYEKYKDYSMLPELTYIRNLELARLANSVPGCIVECGVWRGGMIAGLRELLGPERQYFLFDSFQGLPMVKEIDGPHAAAWQADIHNPGYFNNATASVEEVVSILNLIPVPNYRIFRGWFDETMPSFAPPCEIALLRLDADLYESTRTALTNLAPRLAEGGIVIIDDYLHWDGCARAVHEFLADHRQGRVRRLRQYDDDVFYVTP